MCSKNLTGRGVRVGIIDSGVNPAHPHVGGVAGGVFIGPTGESDQYLDYLGHGTAVAGAIREKAPDALLYAVKVFDRDLTTSSNILLRAIDWCLTRQMRVINLSLGVRNQDPRFPDILDRAARAGALVVAAHGPGCAVTPGTFAVGLCQDCPRETYHCDIDGSRRIFYASGYPRPIPGFPQERNLSGISFAVANMTGFVARAVEAWPVITREAIERALVENRRGECVQA